MRILQVIPFFYPSMEFGGSVSVVYNLSMVLAEKGHEVVVYTTDAAFGRGRLGIREIKYNIDGFDVYYFKNAFRLDSLFISPGMISMIKKEIKSFDVAHLHLYSTFQNVIAHRYLKKSQKPYVLSAHGSVLPIIEKIMLKKLFHCTFGLRMLRDAAKVIAVSSMEKDQYMKAGVVDDKISVIPNGINIDLFKQLPDNGIFRKKFKISEPNIILYVGRIHRRKGIDFLLEAFAKLESKDNILVIAGAEDGYMSTAKEIARGLGVRNKVVFTGFLTEEEKMAAYMDSTVVVSPGVFEIFGLVPLEVALCGKPVIVSNDCGIAEMVEKGGFGFLVDYYDVISLKNYLEKLIYDGDLARKMGSNGRDYVINNISWEKTVSRLEELYMQVIQSDG